MKTTGMFWLFLLTFFLGTACSSETTTEETITEEPATSIVAEPSAEKPTEEPVNDGPLSQEGTLVSFEDSGIPLLWVVTVKGADETKVVYNFEVSSFEEANKYPDWIGKTVKVDYILSTKPELIDLLTEGKTIMEEYSLYAENGNQAKPDWIELVGTLNAPEVTTGDSPGSFTIRNSKGEDTAFEYFILPAMVALNGKEVTAYYRNETREIATKIELK